MAQRRMIHLSLWASEQVGRLSLQARLLYIGLITLADDEGKLKINPSYLKSQIFTYDDSISGSDIRTWTQEIEREGLIVLYVVDGNTYGRHPKWAKYQTLRKDRLKWSNIPTEDSLATNGQPNDNHVSAKPPLKVSKGKVSKDKKREDKEMALAEPSSAEESHINEVFKIFYDTINPTINYGNKTLRASALVLLEKFGLEKTLEMARYAVYVHGQNFAPVITNPTQLKDKLSSLVAFRVRRDSDSEQAKGKDYDN